MELYKVALVRRKDGTFNITVSGKNDSGRVFSITSAPTKPEDVAKKILELYNEYDLSLYPFDNPTATKALGTW